MRDIVETLKHKGYDINVYQDECSESPREWDNLGTMICSHGKYVLGDEKLENYGRSFEEDFYQYIQEKYSIVDFDDEQTFLDNCSGELTEKGDKKGKQWVDKNIIVLRLYLYDHSNITMKTSPFSCQWDSGQVGYIYVDYATIKKEYGVKKVTKKLIEKVKNLLNSEVKIYDDYIKGSIYGYMIEDEEGNETDGCCWGFYGYEWEKNGLLEQAKEEIEGMIKEKEDIKNNVASMAI